MVTRLLIAAALVVVVLVVALVARSRRRPAPPPRTVYPVPRQLDRADFPRPQAAWLVAYFWSRTCDSCEGLAPKVAVLESTAVATCTLEATEDRDLHRRYEIAAIPMILVADAEGVVQRSFVGAVSATDLWAALADVRSPGSVPEPGLGAFED
ncbi:MAG: thioredoxin family protein [Acidimicrobiia bacterium]